MLCFRSGTNYERIAEKDCHKYYIVCSNAPGCGGINKAVRNDHTIATLDSGIYFKDMPGLEKIPRKGAERDSYDKALCTLMEHNLAMQPDLICLAGYDLWIGDWMVDRYFPRILNVHPGDTTKGYAGLGWVPSAKAILAGEDSVRSTVFIVDKGNDTGPVLIQSRPVPVEQEGLKSELYEIRNFAERHKARTPKDFRLASESEGKPLLMKKLESLSFGLQNTLKKEGDWIIYPFAVHELGCQRSRGAGRQDSLH